MSTTDVGGVHALVRFASKYQQACAAPTALDLGRRRCTLVVDVARLDLNCKMLHVVRQRCERPELPGNQKQDAHREACAKLSDNRRRHQNRSEASVIRPNGSFIAAEI